MQYIFIEVPPFTNHRDKLFVDDEDFKDFQVSLLEAPERWPVVKGAAPLRKARWGDDRSRKGKSGGFRVIFMRVPEIKTIFLLHAYSKSRKEDLTPGEARILSQLASDLRQACLARKRRRNR